MQYYYHKRDYPDNILVYIEEYDVREKFVVFDFLDSTEYNSFFEFSNIDSDLNKAFMIILKNYQGKRIQENTIYSINPEAIHILKEQIISNSNQNDSFLIGYTIDFSKINREFFSFPVSINGLQDSLYLNNFAWGGGRPDSIPIPIKGKLSIIIRNVGQGNWNEVSFDDHVRIVYDAGAPMNASKAEVRKIIGNRNILYGQSKPILILSHWDKDHYHSLIGMSDIELRNNFSAFICRNNLPNLTSRILFTRISKALGVSNIYTISAETRTKRGGPTFFSPLNKLNDQIVIYNAQYHKNRNISGIALSIKSQNSSIILPGDAHYDQISRDILKHLNYKHFHNLIVPHHGGNAGAYIYNIPTLVNLNKAIISVGTNHYKHPLHTYIGELKKSGFNILKTNAHGSDIVLPL